MISYSAWKKIQNGEPLTESILGFGSMNLGFGNPQTKLGLAEKKWMDGDSDIVEPAEDKDDPKKVPDEDLEVDMDDRTAKVSKAAKDKSFMKKSGMKKSGKKTKCESVTNEPPMTEEEAKWWESVNSHLVTDLNPKYYTGLDKVTEDKLVTPAAKAEKKDKEPGPGEPGFAPQGRIGALGSYAEWSEKYFSRK